MTDRINVEGLESQYLADMAQYSLPTVVIATRSDLDSQICESSDRSIHHDHWLIQIENPKKRRGTEFWLFFDTVVDFGGLRLNHPTLRPDYTFKKIIFIAGLSRLFGLRFTNKDGTLQFSRQFDWYVRWRLARGIARNEDVKQEDFDAFNMTLASGDILKLVPLYERLEQMFAKLRRGELALSDFIVSSRAAFNWPRLSDELGVPYITLSRSAEFQLALFDGFAQFADGYASAILMFLKPTLRDKGAEGYAAGGSRNLYRPWQLIHRISRAGALSTHRLTFDPFRKTSARSLVAQTASIPSERTLTLLPEDYIRLLRAALEWVFKYHQYIEEAVTLLRRQHPNALLAERLACNDYLDSIRPEGAPKLYMGWVMNKNVAQRATGRIAVGQALKLLLSSTALVIACFAARRSTELADLRVDCVERLRNGYFLTVYIEKTHRDLQKFPVPLAVKAAVDITERLGKTVEGRPEWLFEIPRTGSSRVAFDPTENIREFVEFINLPPPQGMSKWDLTSHVLRRGFAIYLYFGDEWSTLDVVTYALQHFDPHMSRIYLTEILPGEIHRLQDELNARRQIARSSATQEFNAWKNATEARLSEMLELQKDFDEVRLEAYVYRMMSLHRGTDEVIGGLAERLYDDLETLVEQASADVRIASRSNDPVVFETALIDRMKVFFADRSLEPVPGGVMHCGARRGNQDDLEQAVCLTDKRLAEITWGERSVGKPDYVDFAYSGALPCLRCMHGGAFKANQRKLNQKEERLKHAADHAPTPAAAAVRGEAYLQFRDAYQRAKAKKGTKR